MFRSARYEYVLREGLCVLSRIRCHSLGQRWTLMGLAIALAFVPSVSRSATSRRSENTPLIPPVASACVSSPFGPRTLPNRPLAGTFHNGIDLPAPIGSPVAAVAPGTVIRVQRHGVGGLEILIQHEGFVGVYSHL